MKEVKFTDTTLRDAPQSLWNGKMTTPMISPVAPTIDEVGFESLDFMMLAGLDWITRYLHENPWERMRLMAKAMPNTPLIVGGVLCGLGTVSDSVLKLWMKLVVDAGMRRIRVNEPWHDLPRIRNQVKWSKDAGLTTMVSLIYTDSPYHTDEYYARLAKEVAKAGADIIFIKDVGGLLTPERTQTLVPAIMKNIDGIPLEMHGHCTTGLSPLCYLEAIKLGVTGVHTASSPLANGPSQPSAENILSNVRRLGYSPNINEKPLKAIADHFRGVAEKEDLPIGSPVEYDLFQYEHQVPGGMMSNYKFELSQKGIEHRLEEVLEEIALIRKEFGYPIMVTPISQFVGAQAMLNVLGGERYKLVTNETIKYLLGHYGEIVGPVDKSLMDKIMSLPMTKKLLDWEPPQPTIEELRAKFGADISEEELVLRALSSDQDSVDQVMAQGPMNTYG